MHLGRPISEKYGSGETSAYLATVAHQSRDEGGLIARSRTADDSVQALQLNRPD